MREFELLELLIERPKTSQSALAREVGLTPARVNAYIRRFLEAEYIAPEKRSQGMAYHLTSKGKQCLGYHQISYRAELVRLMHAAQGRFRDFFTDLSRQGITRIVLYGAGETGEVVLEALSRGAASAVTVLAVLDDDRAKQGGTCHGVSVVGPRALAELQPQAIVITSITFCDEIRSHLTSEGVEGIPIFSLAG